jgi:hypothetical protein
VVEQGRVVVRLLMPGDDYCMTSNQPGEVSVEGNVDFPTALLGALEVLCDELDGYFDEFSPAQVVAMQALSRELSSWFGDYLLGGAL